MTIASEFPVRYVPKSCIVEMTHQRPVLFVDVKEQVNGRLRLSNYQYFTYVFLRNGKKIYESQEPFMDMQMNRILPDGYFKCIVCTRDDQGAYTGSEFESNGIYLHLHDEFGQDYEDTGEFQQTEEPGPSEMPAYEEVANPTHAEVVQEQSHVETNAGEYGGSRLSL